MDFSRSIPFKVPVTFIIGRNVTSRTVLYLNNKYGQLISFGFLIMIKLPVYDIGSRFDKQALYIKSNHADNIL